MICFVLLEFLLAEDYWLAHPEAEVRIKPSFHEGYGSYQPQLERAIRAMHAQVLHPIWFLHLVDAAACQHAGANLVTLTICMCLLPFPGLAVKNNV